MYPISLDLHHRNCLVVGGGPIAERKIEGLVKEGAQVTVVAPVVTPGIEQWVSDKIIMLHRRTYQVGEATEYCLVLAATDDNAVNRRVFEDGDRAGVFVNVADVPSLCSFHLPSRVERGALKISIASGGTVPFAVRRLRQMFERRLGAEWAEWMDAALRFRTKIRQSALSESEAEHLYDTFFEATVDELALRPRVPKEDEEHSWIAMETSGRE